jgi:hypothetical protein
MSQLSSNHTSIWFLVLRLLVKEYSLQTMCGVLETESRMFKHLMYHIHETMLKDKEQWYFLMECARMAFQKFFLRKMLARKAFRSLLFLVLI